MSTAGLHTSEKIDELAVKMFIWSAGSDVDTWQAVDEPERNYWRRLARIALEYRLEK